MSATTVTLSRIDLARNYWVQRGRLAEHLPGFNRCAGQLAHGQLCGNRMHSSVLDRRAAERASARRWRISVPALLAGKHIVISTATAASRINCFRRDLPMIYRRLGRPVRIAWLKCVANYLVAQSS